MKTRRNLTSVLAASTLLASGICTAAYYAPSPAKSTNHWFIGGEVSALEPVNNDLHYAEEGPNSLSSALGATLVFPHFVHVLDPDFDIGFSVEGGVHFDESNDLTFNYTYFEGDDSAHLAGPAGTIHPRFRLGDDDDRGDRDVHSHVDFEIHIFNGEFGHTAGHGNNTTYRFHGGVQVAHLNNEFESDDHREFSDVSSVTRQFGFRDYTVLDSEFTGAGPRFGADGEYQLNNDFSLVGKTAAALLIGDLDSDVTHQFFAGNVGPELAVPVELQNTMHSHMSETVLVPEFEGKLGVKYTHHTKDNGTLSLEGGYRINDYVAAIKWLHGSISPVNPWPSHLGLHGVYLAGRFTAA